MLRKKSWQMFFSAAMVGVLICSGGVFLQLHETSAEQPSGCHGCNLSGSDLPCACIQYPMFYNGYYYYYYTHRHDDCDNCAEFEPCIYVTSEVLDAQDCESGECPQGSANFAAMSASLPAPLPAGFEITPMLHAAAQINVVSSTSGYVTTSSGRRRIKLFKLHCRSFKSSSPEMLTLGVEIEDDRSPGSFEITAANNFQSYQHIYQGKLDSTDCIILTAN